MSVGCRREAEIRYSDWSSSSSIQSLVTCRTDDGWNEKRYQVECAIYEAEPLPKIRGKENRAFSKIDGECCCHVGEFRDY